MIFDSENIKWKETNIREFRMDENPEWAKFVFVWGNSLAVLPQTEFFHCQLLKIDFFRGTLFFQVEDRSEAPTFTLQIQWKKRNFEAMLRENAVSSGEVFCLNDR